MDCMKCQGLMVQERFSDGFGSIQEWRCVNCGLVLDPIIEQNRQSQAHRQHSAGQVLVAAGAFDASADALGDTVDSFTRSISLVDMIGENCTSEAVGRQVNEMVEDLLNEGHTVKLDFHGVKLVAPPFYRAVVGNLSCTFPEEFLESSLSIVGLAAEPQLK
jgi:hypothetical protein